MKNIWLIWFHDTKFGSKELVAIFNDEPSKENLESILEKSENCFTLQSVDGLLDKSVASLLMRDKFFWGTNAQFMLKVVRTPMDTALN